MHSVNHEARGILKTAASTARRGACTSSNSSSDSMSLPAALMNTETATVRCDSEIYIKNWFGQRLIIFILPKLSVISEIPGVTRKKNAGESITCKVIHKILKLSV